MTSKPRVLVAFHGKRRRNGHLHMEFWLKLLKVAGYQIGFYGPHVHTRTKPVLPFKARRSMTEVTRAWAPDLYLTSNPAWLPKGSFPRVLYEPDVHRVQRAGMRGKFDLVLTRSNYGCRHLRKLTKDDKQPVWWVPFSFDEKLMATVKAHRCKKRVGFAGSVALPHYEARVRALEVLGRAVCRADRWMAPGPYYGFLKGHAVGLACAGRRRLELAKHIEIPAAGALLLTSGPQHMDELLPKGTYVRYEHPASVAEQLERLPSEQIVDMRKRAKAHCWAKHTDSVRIKETLGRLRGAGIVTCASR